MSSTVSLPIVAIVGLPNAGKSSLFNRLVRNREAIVASEAGTTRDTISRLVSLEGKSFRLIDTAGLYLTKQARQSELTTAVEEQVLDAINNADLILAVFDASTLLSPADRMLMRRLHRSRKHIIVVANKIDKVRGQIPTEFQKLGGLPMVGVSTTTGLGLNELSSLLSRRLPSLPPAPEKLSNTIAIVGRPNVGKSSLFNRLVGQARAIVSSQPHTTRDANLAELVVNDRTYQLYDTAGIRKPGKRSGIEGFSFLRTIHAIDRADLAILVLDATEASVRTDQAIAGLVKDAGKGLVIVVNKWDAVEDPEAQRLLIEHKLQTDFAFVWWAAIIFASAHTGQNVAKITELADQVIQTRQQTFPNQQLNALLAQATSQHQPPSFKGKRPQLKSLSQTGTNPPEFTINGRHLDYVHWSYRRYLETQLRQDLNILGTPVKLNWQRKNK